MSVQKGGGPRGGRAAGTTGKWLTLSDSGAQLAAIKAAETALGAARAARASGDHPACVGHASRALEVGPNSVELREIRLACDEAQGNLEAVVGDLTWVFPAPLNRRTH